MYLFHALSYHHWLMIVSFLPSCAAVPEPSFDLIVCCRAGDLWHVHRQEVPVHRQRVDPRPHPDRRRSEDEDAAHDRHPARVPALHPQVQPVREATQEHERPPVPLLPVSAGVVRRHRAMGVDHSDRLIRQRLIEMRGGIFFENMAILLFLIPA